MSSYSLRVKQRQYYSLLDSVRSTLSYVTSANNSIGDCNCINSYYVVDGSAADHNVIGNAGNETYNMMVTLRDQVIPWIENKIRRLENQISEADAEEAAAASA